MSATVRPSGEMDAPELRKYLQFFMKHYRAMDAFWFIYIAEKFDQPTAELGVAMVELGQ